MSRRRPLPRSGGEPRRQGADRAALLFQAVFANTLDAICIFDDTRRYVAVNAAAGRLFGLPPAILLQGHLGDHTAPGQAARFQQAWAQFWAQGQLTGEFVIQRPDGILRTVAFNAQAHILPHQHLAVLRDITAERAAERALSQSEQRFAAAFQASPTLMIIVHLATGQVVDVNDRALQIWGADRAAGIGHPIRTPRLWADLAAYDGIVAACSGRGRCATSWRTCPPHRGACASVASPPK